MGSKHAFLILAHQDFNILQLLVDSLDDTRNDIYIHIDRKVNSFPQIKTNKSRLKFLEGDKRIDVRWGDVSQIEAEFSLFKESIQDCSYHYYHIISGTHLPLVNQDVMHQFFNGRDEVEYFAIMPFSEEELIRKGNRLNLMMKSFSTNVTAQKIWRLGIRIQELIHFKINKKTKFIKASNWVSLTDKAIKYLLENQSKILKKYKYSMCGDELFIPTELALSNKKFTMKFLEDYLYHKVGDANSTVLTMDDYTQIQQSKALFARKFSEQHKDLVDKILNNVKS